MTTTNDRNVVIVLKSGRTVKAPPHMWDAITKAHNNRGSAVSFVDGKLEVLIPLAAIEKVYRAASNEEN